MAWRAFLLAEHVGLGGSRAALAARRHSAPISVTRGSKSIFHLALLIRIFIGLVDILESLKVLSQHRTESSAGAG